MLLYSLIINSLLGITGFSAAYFRKLHLGMFTPFRTRILALFGLLLLAGLLFLFWLGVITMVMAEQLTVGLYSIACGLFLGGSLKNVLINKQQGAVEYLYSSLLTTVIPKALAVIIIAFGIYRTDLLLDHPVTPIGLSSGISLVAFGLYGWSLKFVPEFCRKGILFLDDYISREDVLSYSWHQESVIQIEYYNSDEELCKLRTFIPPDDKNRITAVINKYLLDTFTDGEDE